MGFVLKWFIRIRTHITFYWLFSEQLTAYSLYFKRHILTRNTYQSALAPCVSVLILLECTDSTYKAVRTALSRTAPDTT